MAAFTKNFQHFNIADFFTDPPMKITGSTDPIGMPSADRMRADMDPLDNPNRVSLKMEVSWTEHSHIIGREGRSIKSVSTVTNCHIHFPDSNRFSETEKCNQVSIAGDPQAVETARAQVRNLSPVIFAFEIPFATEIQSILESRQSPQMQYIQNAYNVQIIVRNKGRPGTVALVKGNSWDLDKVKAATRSLMQHLCQGEAEVMMYLEISPHYHSSVLGSNGASHVRAIMAVTNTMIVWPNLADTSLHPLRKSTFVISGQIDKVYLAREMLIGSLPLVLMSDLPHGLELEMEQVQHVMTTLKVTVSTRPKNKNGVLHRTLVIRGTERHVDRLYEARRILLGLPLEARVVVQVPESYHVPPVPPSVPLQQTYPMHSVQALLPIPGSAASAGSYGRFSPEPSAAGGLLGWFPGIASGAQPNPTMAASSHHHYMNALPPAAAAAGYPYQYLAPSENAKLYASVGAGNSWMYPDRRMGGSTPVNQRAYSYQGSNDWNFGGSDRLNTSFLNSTGTGGTDVSCSNSLSSSSYSLFSASASSGSSTSPTHSISAAARAAQQSSVTSGMGKLGAMLHVGSPQESHGVPPAPIQDIMASTLDYNARKALASRAMSQEVHPDVPRTPTTVWSGMGFSKSHSAALLAQLNRGNFGLGGFPSASSTEERMQSKDGKYCHQATPRPAPPASLEEDDVKKGDTPQKDRSGSSAGCRVTGNSGSLSSIGSIASSQQTLMSPSFADRASTAEWRSSWSDFETEDCSINESFFMDKKPSIGSYGSPEKAKPPSLESGVGGITAGLGGFNIGEPQSPSIKRGDTVVDGNNNGSPIKKQPAGARIDGCVSPVKTIAQSAAAAAVGSPVTAASAPGSPCSPGTNGSGGTGSGSGSAGGNETHSSSAAAPVAAGGACAGALVPRSSSSGAQVPQHISFSSSNVIDGVVPLPRSITSGYKDIYDVLAKLCLSRYIEVFQGQDIDFATFLTLTEDDLARLGISTFGARRKILVAIKELRKQGPVFSGSVAVGAERRPSNF